MVMKVEAEAGGGREERGGWGVRGRPEDEGHRLLASEAPVTERRGGPPAEALAGRMSRSASGPSMLSEGLL